jgi:hypothetical protein
MGYELDEIEENISSTDLDSNDEYLARQPLSTTMGSGDSLNPGNAVSCTSSPISALTLMVTASRVA